MLETIVDAGLVVADKIGVPLVVAAVTAGYMTRRVAGGEVPEHDRRVGELDEDLRRWVRDRDREASLRMDEIAQQATAQGVKRGRR